MTRPDRVADTEYPYVLTTDRILRQYQNGTQTRRIPSLAMTDCVPLVELHPDLARRHGIRAGDQVELRTRRGCAVFRAHLTRHGPPGHRVHAVPLG